MWIKEISIESNVSKESIWRLYHDVQNWNKWDTTVEYSNIEGKFEVGSKGKLKSKDGPKTSFIINECNPFSSYTISSVLPLSKLNFIHEINEVGSKIMIIHKVEIVGLLSSVFGKILGEKIIKDLPNTLRSLVKMAGDNRL